MLPKARPAACPVQGRPAAPLSCLLACAPDLFNWRNAGACMKPALVCSSGLKPSGEVRFVPRAFGVAWENMEINGFFMVHKWEIPEKPWVFPELRQVLWCAKATPQDVVCEKIADFTEIPVPAPRRGGNTCGWPVSRILSGALRPLYGHSSGPAVAGRLLQPTRAVGGGVPCLAACSPYLALLLTGFTVPPLLPSGRWSLTPPFHPYPACRAVCFLWHFPSGCPGRPLTGVIPPWSPDFPHPQGVQPSSHPHEG